MGRGVLAIKFTCEAGKWPLKERSSQNFFPRVTFGPQKAQMVDRAVA